MLYNALIIIPTYNESKNIVDLISRIRSLNIYENILVIDDNSPDGTANIVKKYNDNNLVLLTREKKMGLGSAYCMGYKYAIKNILIESLKKLLIEIFFLLIIFIKNISKKNSKQIGMIVAKKITRVPNPKPITIPIKVEKYFLLISKWCVCKYLMMK